MPTLGRMTLIVLALTGSLLAAAAAHAQSPAPDAAGPGGAATPSPPAATPAATPAPAAPAPAPDADANPGPAAGTPTAASHPAAAPAPDATAAASPSAVAPVPPAATASEPSKPDAAAAAVTPPAAPPPPPAFTVDIAGALERVPGKASIDKRDRTGLLAAYEGRQNRPVWVDAKGPLREALKLAAEIRRADRWGLKTAAFDVPKLQGALKGDAPPTPEALADMEVRLSLAALKYARYARGGHVEPHAITPFLDRKPALFDPKSLLDQLAVAAEPGEYLLAMHPRHVEFDRLRRKYLALLEAGKASGDEGQRLLANMEQWRWMPADLGRLHVWVNVPEFTVRLVRDGKIIHTERVVVGKLDTQTPIFSQAMEQIVFHPVWGVPESIKQMDILPSLQKGGAIMKRHNLRLQLAGKDIDPATVDWSKADIRRYHVYQPPGGPNVLGVVKFRFPNKHDVYMHDTPSKSLFKPAVRAYSHGCMRVQDPVKLAELILAEDKRMSPEKVQALAGPEGAENVSVGISRRIPVHITYFTASVDEAGKLTTFADIYGHEERVRLALDGRMSQIKPVPPPKPGETAEPIGHLAEINATPADWRSRAYDGGG